jgi:flagellar hook-basal body complex protein FliE
MSLAPISGWTGLPGATPSLPAAAKGAGAPPGFGDLVTRFLEETNEQQLKVGTHIEALATGKSDNVHDVVLSVAQADLAFRLMMEIRNRAIASYQEIMRMQV